MTDKDSEYLAGEEAYALPPPPLGTKPANPIASWAAQLDPNYEWTNLYWYRYNLTERARNILRGGDVRDRAHALELGVRGLSFIPNCGRVTANHIVNVLTDAPAHWDFVAEVARDLPIGKLSRLEHEMLDALKDCADVAKRNMRLKDVNLKRRLKRVYALIDAIEQGEP